MLLDLLLLWAHSNQLASRQVLTTVAVTSPVTILWLGPHHYLALLCLNLAAAKQLGVEDVLIESLIDPLVPLNSYE